MANIFEQWDKNIDTEGLQKDVADAAQNGGNFEEVPHGTYEVAIKQMELKASKKGDPMVVIWFKVVDGPHKNGIIFLNQVITQGFQIHIVNELLRKLVEEADNAPEIEFRSYKQYNELLLDVFEITDGFEYGLKYTANSKNKDFSDYEITEVFPLN